MANVCDNTNATINTHATEILCDGIDQCCDEGGELTFNEAEALYRLCPASLEAAAIQRSCIYWASKR